jgi:hypothetical protein
VSGHDVEEVDLAQAGVDGLALAGRQLLIVQPGPAFDSEEVRSRRTVLQAARQDSVDLVLHPRARPDELRATGQPAAHRADALIGRPDPIELARPQQLGQRPRIEAISLGPRLTDAASLGETTITRATCASRIRAIAHALPVSSNVTQSRASRLWANSASV